MNYLGCNFRPHNSGSALNPALRVSYDQKLQRDKGGFAVLSSCDKEAQVPLGTSRRRMSSGEAILDGIPLSLLPAASKQPRRSDARVLSLGERLYSCNFFRRDSAYPIRLSLFLNSRPAHPASAGQIPPYSQGRQFWLRSWRPSQAIFLQGRWGASASWKLCSEQRSSSSWAWSRDMGSRSKIDASQSTSSETQEGL